MEWGGGMGRSGHGRMCRQAPCPYWVARPMMRVGGYVCVVATHCPVRTLRSLSRTDWSLLLPHLHSVSVVSFPEINSCVLYTQSHSKLFAKFTQLSRLLLQFRVPALVVAEARRPLEAAGTAVDGALKRQFRRVQPRVRARIRPEAGHDAAAGVGAAKAHRLAATAPPPPPRLGAQRGGGAGGRLGLGRRRRRSALGRGAWQRRRRHRRRQHQPACAPAAAPRGAGWARRRGARRGPRRLEWRRFEGAVRRGRDRRAGAHQRRVRPRRRTLRGCAREWPQGEDAQRGRRGVRRRRKGASAGGLEGTDRRAGAQPKPTRRRRKSRGGIACTLRRGCPPRQRRGRPPRQVGGLRKW